jgi:MFS family permease
MVVPPGSPAPTPTPTSTRRVWRSLPAGVWAMGFASLCMDTSSELIHSLLPLFMVTTLGASMVTVGLVEGLAEAVASVMKVFSGSLSDRLGNRKLLMVAGYGLAALTKPVFPLASSMPWILTARVVDRLGKGIRGAPRDALVADLTPPSLRGAAYGLRQALDSVGAIAGPLLAVGLMIWWTNDVRAVLWVATIPAGLAVVVLVLRVREPGRGIPLDRVARPSLVAGARRLPGRFWLVALLGAVMTLARFSEAFLVLRAQDVGLPVGQVPWVMVVMNVFYAGSAYPLGAAADRVPPRRMLLAGMVLLMAADGVLALAVSPLPAFAGAALWGLHLGFTQGLLSKLVAEAAPARALGTAFGVFHLVTGGAVLLASVLAGGLWARLGPAATFFAGAGIAAVAAIGLLVAGGWWRCHPRHESRIG